MTDYTKNNSDKIEDFIRKPVSFSLNDDFFNEDTSSKEKYRHLYDNIKPLVEPKEYTPTNSTQKEEPKNRKAEEIPASDSSKKKKRASVDLLPDPANFRYQAAPEDTYEEPVKKREESVKEEKSSFTQKEDQSIFGEKRDDSDILFKYNVERLIDIQKELSVLIVAIQRLQTTENRLSQREEDLRIKAEKLILEQETKKDAIDKIVKDLKYTYDIIRLRNNLLEEKEQFLMEESSKEDQPLPELNFTAYIPDASAGRSPKWAEKPYAEKETTERVKSFSEIAAEKNAEKKNEFEISDVPSFGLNNTSISAINSAINSLK